MKVKYHHCDEGSSTYEFNLYGRTATYEICVEGTADVDVEVKPYSQEASHLDDTKQIELGFMPLDDGVITAGSGPSKFSGFHEKLKLTSTANFKFIVNGGDCGVM